MSIPFIQILLTQLVAYCLANFIIVPSYYLTHNKRYLKPKLLWPFVKGGVFFFFSYLLTWRESFLIGSIILSVVVTVSSMIFDRKACSNTSFLTGQSMQLMAMLIVIPAFAGWTTYSTVLTSLSIWSGNVEILWVALAFLLCLGPANVAIRFILNSYDLIPNSDKGESLVRAGRFIGNVERVITLTLVLSNQFAAIGLFMAAKSVLRLKENDFRTSEYVLVGTLLSFGIAIVLGIFSVRVISHF